MITRILKTRTNLSALSKFTNSPLKLSNSFKCRAFSTLTENDFLKLWFDFQHEFIEQLENEELGPYEDFEDNAETVTVESLDGQILVLSRHSGNREIWLSSPISGPSHFRYSDGQWLNKHDMELRAQLREDFSKM